jgi:hypothetical protein
VLNLVIERQFGMPLYADNPSSLAGAVCFNSLDNTAGAGRGDSYPRGRFADGMTVQADDFRQAGDAQGLRELTARVEFNRVTSPNQVESLNVFFFAKVSDRSAQGNVQYLAPTADSEHGQASPPGSANERDFKVVAKPMNQPCQVRVAAVKIRIHVAAAGKEHPIDLLFFEESFNRFRADRDTDSIWSKGYEAPAGCRHDTLVSRVGYTHSTQQRIV